MILAIDSAPGLTGWALVRREGTKEALIATGELREVTARVVEDFAARVTAKPGMVELVAIEDAYLGKNVGTLKALSRTVGRWQQVFEVARIPTRLVMASVWQRGLLDGLITGKTTGQGRKAAAITWVRSVYGLDLPPDEADAACMATWVSRERARAKLIRQAIRSR